METYRNQVLQHSLTTKARVDVHANIYCYNLGFPVGRYYFLLLYRPAGQDKLILAGWLLAVNHPRHQILRIYREEMIDDVISQDK